MTSTVNQDPTQFIANAEKVISIYGEWPTFHDAEVLSVVLDRGDVPKIAPSISARIWTFKVHRDETDSDGYSKRSTFAVVSLRFEKPEGLVIEEFNHQNVLAGIALEFVDEMVDVTMEGLFGIHCSFRCSKASVEAVEVLGGEGR